MKVMSDESMGEDTIEEMSTSLGYLCQPRYYNNNLEIEFAEAAKIAFSKIIMSKIRSEST